jgi:hypothetical protein
MQPDWDKMSDLGETIASEELFGQRAGEERFPITIEIARPYKWGGTSPTEWACPVRVDPFFSRRDGCHGEGSLQALCLALQAVHMELLNFKQSGATITLASGEEFPLEAYWPANWLS